jgi:hypothetical protein
MVVAILLFCSWRKKRRFSQPVVRQHQHQHQQRQQEHTQSTNCPLRPALPIRGPKQRRWEALVKWDPHIVSPYHGHCLLRDGMGHIRVVKTSNLIPSNAPRQFPPKIRFSSEVAVQCIPRRDDPVNMDAWNRTYHHNVAVNNQWQQQQFQHENEVRRAFRRTVIVGLTEHANTLKWKWTFRRLVVPAVVDHSHSLRWQWALNRHQVKAKFHQAVLGFLDGHGRMLREKWGFKSTFRLSVLPALVDHRRRLRVGWKAKSFFSGTVVPALANHSMKLRFKWALQEAARQWPPESWGDDDDQDDSILSITKDDATNPHTPTRLQWEDDINSFYDDEYETPPPPPPPLENEVRRAFRRTVIVGLTEHANTMKWKWTFRRFVVPAVVDHSHSLRWQWALNRHQVKAKFHQAVLGFLDGHGRMLREKWGSKSTFRLSVLPALVDHRRRLLVGWKAKSFFSGTVVPALANHSIKLRFKWALQEAARQWPPESWGDDDDLDDSILSITKDDATNPLTPTRLQWEDDINSFYDDEYETPPPPTPPPPPPPPATTRLSTRPRRRRPPVIVPTVDCATVWVDGCRRSRRLQPTLGSIYENGRRRSARLL